MRKATLLPFFFSFFFLVACSSNQTGVGNKEAVEDNKNTRKNTQKNTTQKRIVSLAGNITETLCRWGYRKEIVGVDVTSTYPKEIDALPKVGHVRSLSLEGIIALEPTIVLAKEGELNSGYVKKLEQAGVEVKLLPGGETLEGVEKFYTTLGNYLGKQGEAEQIVASIKEKIGAVRPTSKKVLFVYARSAGSMMVAGGNTGMSAMIEWAGASNVAKELDDYKPFSQESLVDYNPDAILFFDSGLKSVGGVEAVLSMPGVSETTAGQNKAILGLDGYYIAGFGPRMGDAALELNANLRAYEK